MKDDRKSNFVSSFFLLLSFFLPHPFSSYPHLGAPVVARGLAKRRPVCIDVAAVDADVRGQRLLRGRQLAAKPLRGGLLRQPLDVDALVLALHELDADGAGGVGERRAREREVVRRPELVAEEGRGVDDRVADRDARGGGVALDALDDEASAGGLGGGELEGEGLVDLDLKRVGGGGEERERERLRGGGGRENLLSREELSIAFLHFSCLSRTTKLLRKQKPRLTLTVPPAALTTREEPREARAEEDEETAERSGAATEVRRRCCCCCCVVVVIDADTSTVERGACHGGLISSKIT